MRLTSSRSIREPARVIRLSLFAIVLIAAVPMLAHGGGLGLGRIARAVGIGGDVGRALDRVDDAVGKGSKLIRGFMDLPGEALFGGAIREWRTANEQVVDRLGRTNDATVEKLVGGLDSVSSRSIAQLGDELDASIESLDGALRVAVLDLDQSLSSQTLRLDAVLEKQATTLYRLVLYSFLAILFVSFVIAAVGLVTTLRGSQTIERGRAVYRNATIALACAVGIVLALTETDPLGYEKRVRQAEKSYDFAMGQEDFARARNEGAVLTALEPSNDEYARLHRRALLFRNVTARPTLLHREEGLSQLLGDLAQGDAESDPDVRALMMLIGAVRSQTERDVLHVQLLAATLADPDTSADASEQRSTTDRARVPSLRSSIGRVAPILGSLLLPKELLDRALLSGQDSLHIERITSSLTRVAVPFFEAFGNDSATRSYSVLDDLVEIAQLRLLVRSYYRELSARAMHLLYLDAQGTTNINEKNTSYCDLMTFADSAHSKLTGFTSQELVLGSAMLTGPFSMIRLAKAVHSRDSCPRLDPQRLLAITDPIGLLTRSVGVSTSARRAQAFELLRRTAVITEASQRVALDTLRARYKKYVLVRTLEDTTRATAIWNLAQVSAIAGIYVYPGENAGGTPIPLSLLLYRKHEQALTTKQWQEVFRMLLASGGAA